jgi:release factor glutamine methyltransferase
VLGLTRSALAVERERGVEPTERDALVPLVERRGRREPLQHILGEWGFRRLTLKVDVRALVPRPETEVVVERSLALLAGRRAPAVLDVGTGAGAIALAIADEHAGARVRGVDASAAALALARENAERCGLPVELAQHDLHDGLPPGPWDLVVSNPPYVPLADRDRLPPEVRDWEPAAALHGAGATEAIARHAMGVLAPGGALVLEVGDGQAARVAALVSSLGYADVRVTADLTGRERVVEGRR